MTAMTAEAYFIRQKGALVPSDEAAVEVMRSIKMGETVRVEITRPRNPQHHRLFFALLHVVQPNTSYRSIDELLAVIKLGIGHVDLAVTPSGEACWIPKSISFAKMDQAAFRAFWDRAIDYILASIIPGTERVDLERQVNEIIGNIEEPKGKAA